MPQEPALQVGVPLILLHALPQPLQFDVSVLRLTSQPLAGLPSQSAKPGLQAIWQLPLTHEGLPLLFEQTLPHEPQLLTSLYVLISQPLLRLPSQFAQPALQLMPQLPVVHVALPLVELQTLPHEPQCCGSEAMLISQPLAYWLSQFAKPELQACSWHVPVAQATCALGTVQSVLQLPQCAVSVIVLTSQPLASWLSQLAKPPAHDAMPH
jgi:hypothetical protein